LEVEMEKVVIKSLKRLIAALRSGSITAESLDRFLDAAPAPVKNWRWRKVSGTAMAIEVDLDAPDELPFDGVKRDWAPPAGNRGYVRVERVGDDLLVGGKRTLLHLDDGQKDGRSLTGHSLQPRLQSLATLDPRILDALFENPHLIPESWKMDEKGRTRFIFFWGAGYRDSRDCLCVRYLYWDDGAWGRRCNWLDYGWSDQDSAAVSAS
jgi:hypothetical protein